MDKEMDIKPDKEMDIKPENQKEKLIERFKPQKGMRLYVGDGYYKVTAVRDNGKITMRPVQ